MWENTDGDITMDSKRYDKLVEGNEAAWSWFYNKYSGLVKYWVSGILRPYPMESKEDVVQTTFMKVFRGISTYDHTRPIEPWLKVVTQNNCADWYNYTYKPTEELVDYKAPTPDVISYIDICLTLEELKPQHKELLALLIRGYSPSDIAELQEISIQTVYSRLYSLRKKVKEIQ